jgi:concanavalin A-like lectin/glucanase superfamily protein
VSSSKVPSSRLWLAAVALLFGAAAARASTVSPNTGLLGSAADGTNADSVTFGPGAVSAGGDQSAVYDGVTGTKTTVPFQAALNPPSASPFTVEFWGKPAASDNDDAPVSNRVASGNRSGWVFFQRAPATGWNFRMYSGAGSALGFDLTGGTSNLDEWSHVVATWNGTNALLYVNGQLADDSNDPGASGVYNANPATTAANLIVAMSDTGSPYTGSVDETAFYPTALTAAQVLSHFNAASSATPGEYQSLVRSDGALLQLSNNAVPEPSAVVLLGAALPLLLRRRAARRQG